MKKVRWTKSASFLLPLTMLPINTFDKFLNVYCRCDFDKDNSDYKYRRIYVVFRSKDLTEKLDLEITRISTFHKRIEIDEFFIYVYVPRPEYYDDYDKFIKGKYSKFSERYKKLLTVEYGKYKKGESVKTKIYKVIYPTKTEIDSLSKLLNVENKDLIEEVMSKPDLYEETFKLSHYYQLKIAE
jgi:hypothetical protein